jgi:hypothetical protein
MQFGATAILFSGGNFSKAKGTTGDLFYPFVSPPVCKTSFMTFTANTCIRIPNLEARAGSAPSTRITRSSTAP